MNDTDYDMNITLDEGTISSHPLESSLFDTIMWENNQLHPQ